MRMKCKRELLQQEYDDTMRRLINLGRCERALHPAEVDRMARLEVVRDRLEAEIDIYINGR